jgi:hypothetical protein
VAGYEAKLQLNTVFTHPDGRAIVIFTDGDEWMVELRPAHVLEVRQRWRVSSEWEAADAVAAIVGADPDWSDGDGGW